MLRLICFVLLLIKTAAAEPPPAPPLRPSAAFAFAGPAAARGALVWLPGTTGPTDTGPPGEPAWVDRMARRGLDIWRFDRIRGQDPLAGSGEALTRGLQALRKAGYRRILAAGHSRGAWIALTVLAHPGTADGIVALSPAAHGTKLEHRTQAMADWIALWSSAASKGTRVVMVQLADDPYDPEPERRRDIAATASQRAGIDLLPLFLPPLPRGHIGAYEPELDDAFGETMASFADPGYE